MNRIIANIDNTFINCFNLQTAINPMTETHILLQWPSENIVRKKLFYKKNFDTLH